MPKSGSRSNTSVYKLYLRNRNGCAMAATMILGEAIGEGGPIHRAALDMLTAFGSVGAGLFDVTWTDTTGQKQFFSRRRELTELSREVPEMLDRATRERRNLIVRPYGDQAVFLQLDDLDTTALDRVRPAAFLTLVTSPANHQAWIALAGPPPGDFARRVRKGTGADATASGATRVAGSFNFKEKYAPAFPRVMIGHVASGRITTPAELDEMGLVGAPDAIVPALAASPPRSRGPRRWPDYRRCLDGAPANSAGDGPDVSRADFTFAMIAADWGWSVDDVAGRLMEESVKAQENGPKYARITAVRAAQAAGRRNSGGACAR
jgi:hypothetical protein